MDKEVNISYETLFELLRREKSREEIQKLEESFVHDVNKYLREKIKLLESDRTKIAQNPGEAEMIQTQIENTKRIVRELYERREKKILHMALYRSKIPLAKLSTENLLSFEKELLDRATGTLSDIKNGAMRQLFETGSSETPKASTQATAVVAEKKEDYNIEFLEDVPEFVGLDFEPLGPFNKGDKAKLPDEIAMILENKGQAKKL
ncbi:hypothetical protein JXA85_00325 [Candidatus Woesearchaeota archaeon]|nr:hypothetical protein [Candidatus Woesearchaeota archaeon]